jgi:hypothetical protein
MSCDLTLPFRGECCEREPAPGLGVHEAPAEVEMIARPHSAGSCDAGNGRIRCGRLEGPEVIENSEWPSTRIRDDPFFQRSLEVALVFVDAPAFFAGFFQLVVGEILEDDRLLLRAHRTERLEQVGEAA